MLYGAYFDIIYHEEHEVIEDKEKDPSCSWLSIIKLSELMTLKHDF